MTPSTVRNRVYSVIGGQITVIDGTTNTIAGSFALGAGVTATGAVAVDSVKNRLYAVGTAAGVASLYVVDDAPAGPGCVLQVNQSVYVNGAVVSIGVFRLTNHDPAATKVELKFWLGACAFAAISLANIPTFPLAAGYAQNLGPINLFSVSAAFPRGGYELGCRLLNPVTGKTQAESIASFTIQ